MPALCQHVTEPRGGRQKAGAGRQFIQCEGEGRFAKSFDRDAVPGIAFVRDQGVGGAPVACSAHEFAAEPAIVHSLLCGTCAGSGSHPRMNCRNGQKRRQALKQRRPGCDAHGQRPGHTAMHLQIFLVSEVNADDSAASANHSGVDGAHDERGHPGLGVFIECSSGGVALEVFQWALEEGTERKGSRINRSAPVSAIFKADAKVPPLRPPVN